MDAAAPETAPDTIGDAFHRRVDVVQRLGTRRDRDVGEIDVDGKARHITDEQVDCRAAFERETRLLGDERQHAYQ